jgi:flagellar biogenesis protein FliO
MDDVNNKSDDDKKTNEELLNEISKLRKATEDQNKKTNESSAFNTMIAIGAILLFIGGGVWLFVQCAL